MDQICMIDVEALFKRAKIQNVPFFKFIDWVKTEMDKECFQILFQLNKEKSEEKFSLL